MPDQPRTQIIVGIDGSPGSDAALAWACEEARLREAVIIALHVIDVPYELPREPITEPNDKIEKKGQHVLDGALARAPGEGVTIEPRLLEGAPGELLIEASDGALLVVVGARRHGALTSLVRSSPFDAVVHHAHCPVVVVHG